MVENADRRDLTPIFVAACSSTYNYFILTIRLQRSCLLFQPLINNVLITKFSNFRPQLYHYPSTAKTIDHPRSLADHKVQN
jgi:hypothetical protein